MTVVAAHGPRPARAPGRILAALGLPLVGAWQTAVAQTAPQTQVESAPARQWDTAEGFVANHGPRYPGADRCALSMSGVLLLGWADRRHLQTYFGVTPEQALRSGHPTTPVSTGPRDLTLSVGLRQALGPRWAVFGNTSLSRLLGQAASSPLTREPGSWGLGFGVVHRL